VHGGVDLFGVVVEDRGAAPEWLLGIGAGGEAEGVECLGVAPPAA
jgi:hypothetical protein